MAKKQRKSAHNRKDGAREPSGRLSRQPAERKVRDAAAIEATEWDTMGQALMARNRVHGVEPANLRDQLAGSAVGRMYLKGQITRTQLEASQAYVAERDEYYQYIQVPRQPGAVDLNATKGASTAAENVPRVIKVTEAVKATDRAVMEAQIEIGNFGNLFGALNTVLVMDVELDHLVGDLRTALNALARRYGLTGRAKAA
jgi:hypothetical protein